jgi:hypothetical protein
MIKSVAICTGLGGMVESTAAKNSKADCYILGEATSHHSKSDFGARIEIGHTLSESPSGLAFFRKHLEPHGITVDQASLEHDKYSGEVYQKPVFNRYFSEEATAEDDEKRKREEYLGRPQMGDLWGGGWKRKGSTYSREPGKTWGPAWRDIDWNEWEDTGKATQELTGQNDDMPPDPDEEADFWANYWAKKNAGERAPVTKKPDLGDLRPVSTDIPGVRRDLDEMFEGTEEKPKKIEKPPAPPGGDFAEGGE